jgi:hypothetical protein
VDIAEINQPALLVVAGAFCGDSLYRQRSGLERIYGLL